MSMLDILCYGFEAYFLYIVPDLLDTHFIFNSDTLFHLTFSVTHGKDPGLSRCGKLELRDVK